ncbi:MAG: leucine-rich repeat protein [Verrucomicrobiota bacterium]
MKQNCKVKCPLLGGFVQNQCARRLISRWGAIVFTLAILLGFQANAAVQHVAGGYLFSGTNYTVLISDTNGSIVSMTTGGGVIATGGEYGLWMLTSTNTTLGTTGTLNASSFASTSSSNTFQAALSGSAVLLSYSNSQVSVAVTLTGNNDGVDMTATVTSGSLTVTGITLPARLRFDPASLQRFIAPNHSSDGVGMSYTPGFFQVQTEITPASWTQVIEGPAGYISLYGGPCQFVADNNPEPLGITTDGTNWLGSTVVSTYSSATAIVNRPPAAGQADVVLIGSTNGAFFSGSHLGGGSGAGYLMRLGGAIDPSRVQFSTDIVTAALAHMVQTGTSGRLKVGLLSMVRGPVIGFDWPSAVTVDNWTAALNSSSALISSSIQIVNITTVADMMTALSGTDYVAVINPYGELVPASLGGDIAASVTNIGNYVRAGGNWFEVAGYSFYQALKPVLYYSVSLPYPPAFADFLQLDSTNGSVSVFGVQPVPSNPWSGASDPTTLFVPGQLDYGGDALGGYCDRGFVTYVSPGHSWQSPVVRFFLGHLVSDSLASYASANLYTRTLSNKMTASTLSKFLQSVMINYQGASCSQLTQHLSQLPTPALLHNAQYIHGGFDKQYPDLLPPNPTWGSSSDFQTFIAQARQDGMLTMPYTNPTFWGINPEGPTFLASGTAPLLVNPDGTLSLEAYFGNSGYTASPWHPGVKAASVNTVNQFLTTYPVDFCFEDQIGARAWQYDFNTASPTPYAYMSGNIARAAEDSISLPVSTENGFDRLINYESQFCGLAWGLAPTPGAPVWRRYLRDRFAPSTWQIFPLAQYLSHDKLAMSYNDLSAPVANDECVAWTLGLGYTMSYTLNAADIDTPATRQWLLWIDRLQKSICAQYIGQPVSSFTHQWGAQSPNPDNGTIQATYGPVNVFANLGSQTLSNNGYTVPANGFVASGPGLFAGKIIPGGTNAVLEVAQTGTAGGLDFWVYSRPNQSPTVTLPPGFNGTAVVQLDGTAPVSATITNNTFTVNLGPAASSTTSYLWHGSLVNYTYTTSTNNTVTIQSYTGPGGAVTVPSAINGHPVTGIANYAFNGISGITSVTIPNSVTGIGNYAFLNCTGLTNATIGSGVTSIGTAAFQGCSGLTSLTISGSVASIGNYAFFGCSLLASVTIPASVTSIGAGAFQGCSSLSGVTIPGSVANIGDYAFFGCSSLINLAINSGVTSIGNGAFQGCTSLTSVKLPKSLTSLGIWAFSYCPGLASVYFTGNSPGADSSTFSNDSSLTLYYLPGTTGWTNPWKNQPTICWNPRAQNFGVHNNEFGFTITGPNNLVVIVDGCSDLVHPVWVPLSTNTLTGGTSAFSDSQSSGYRARFYRFRAP